MNTFTFDQTTASGSSGIFWNTTDIPSTSTTFTIWDDPRDLIIKELQKKIKELEDMLIEHILLDVHE